VGRTGGRKGREVELEKTRCGGLRGWWSRAKKRGRKEDKISKERKESGN